MGERGGVELGEAGRGQAFLGLKFMVSISKLILGMLRTTGVVQPALLYVTYSNPGLNPVWKHGFNPWLGKSPGEGHADPLQRSCLENPMDRGVWRATVHRVTESEMTKVT